MNENQPITFDEIHNALSAALTEAAADVEQKRAARCARLTEIYATLQEPERTAAIERLLAQIFGSIMDRIETALAIGPRRH